MLFICLVFMIVVTAAQKEMILCNGTDSKVDSPCSDRRVFDQRMFPETLTEKPLTCSATGPTQKCVCNYKALVLDLISACVHTYSGEQITKDYGLLLRATENGRADLAMPVCDRRRAYKACIVRNATKECASGASQLLRADLIREQSGDLYFGFTETIANVGDPEACRNKNMNSPIYNYLKVCPNYCDEPGVVTSTSSAAANNKSPLSSTTITSTLLAGSTAISELYTNSGLRVAAATTSLGLFLLCVLY